MKLKTLGSKGNITLKDYDEKELKEIFIERNSYVLECIHDWGEDYGGSQNDENRETYYEEIIPERILVKDGHFCGVLILTHYDYCNGSGKDYYEETALLIGKGGSARDGYSFSNDDHDRWNHTDYYLVKRPREEQK